MNVEPRHHGGSIPTNLCAYRCFRCSKLSPAPRNPLSRHHLPVPMPPPLTINMCGREFSHGKRKITIHGVTTPIIRRLGRSGGRRKISGILYTETKWERARSRKRPRLATGRNRSNPARNGDKDQQRPSYPLQYRIMRVVGRRIKPTPRAGLHFLTPLVTYTDFHGCAFENLQELSSMGNQGMSSEPARSGKGDNRRSIQKPALSSQCQPLRQENCGSGMEGEAPSANSQPSSNWSRSISQA